MMNSINRRRTELYDHPDNAKRICWFTESFIGACLLHPKDKATVTAVTAKFNQRLAQPLTQPEQQAVYRRLRDEFSTN